jgi:ABC-type lipoprotein release transport system permease subunit
MIVAGGAACQNSPFWRATRRRATLHNAMRLNRHAVIQGLLLGVLVLLLGTALVQEKGRTDKALASAPTAGRLAISADESTRGSTLTVADASALTQVVPGIASNSRVERGEARVAAGNQQQQVRVEAVDPSFEQIEAWPLGAGSFFGQQDDVAANRLAVLGSSVADSLFPGTSAVGQTVIVRDVPFNVVGVLASNGTARDSTVLVPFQTGQVRLFGAHGLDEVVLELRDPTATGTTTQQIEQVLRARHGLQAGQADDFTVRSAAAETPPVSISVLSRTMTVVRGYACLAKDLCTI